MLHIFAGAVSFTYHADFYTHARAFLMRDTYITLATAYSRLYIIIIIEDDAFIDILHIHIQQS